MSDTDTTLWALSTAGTEALEERAASGVAPTPAGLATRADVHLEPVAPAGNAADQQALSAFYGPI